MWLCSAKLEGGLNYSCHHDPESGPAYTSQVNISPPSSPMCLQLFAKLMETVSRRFLTDTNFVSNCQFFFDLIRLPRWSHIIVGLPMQTERRKSSRGVPHLPCVVHDCTPIRSPLPNENSLSALRLNKAGAAECSGFSGSAFYHARWI